MSNASFGLFTRTEVKERVVSITKAHALPVERLRALGLKGVKRMNREARCPEMEPEGPQRASVYILGEAPGETEDAQGSLLAGEVGKMLRPEIPRRWREKVRINNVVRTLPPLRKGEKGRMTRKPTPTEVECFRPSLEEDIERARPTVIIGMGNVPMEWVLGAKFSSITVVRGRRFPVKVGKHLCWYYPVLHPAHILYAFNTDKADRSGDDEKTPPEELKRAFVKDMARPFRDLEEGLPEPEVESGDVDEQLETVLCLDGSGGEADVKRIIRYLAELETKPCYGIDVEANRFRPYGEGAKLLTVSVGTYRSQLAFPIDHPQSRFTKEQRARVVNALRKLLLSPARKVAHNLATELEWFAWFYGREVLRGGGMWHCSMQQAYCIDNRQGGLSLNFLSAQRFGLKLKRISKGKKIQTSEGPLLALFAKEDDEIDRSQLEKTRLIDVLQYNGLDVKFCYKLHRIQLAELKATGRYNFYKQYQVRRVATVVNAQLEGLVVNRPEVVRWGKTLGGKARKVVEEIKTLPVVKEFEKRYGEFSPTSNPHLVKMFQEVCGRQEGRRGSKYSTDKRVLADIGKKGKGADLAKLLLAMRKPAKLKSTYVDPLDIKSEKPVVHPDGKLHGRFTTTRTNTGRLSIEDPSLQNFPKRDALDKAIRSVIGCPEGHVILAVDEGQLEYRMLGMHSRDPVLVDSLFTGYDVHMHWAERIVKKYDKTFIARGGNIKEFRSDVKNQWVFPLCFGSSPFSCARNLEMPDRIAKDLADEFWDQLKKVKKWQKKVMEGYEQNFYVECLSGRRRQGPISYNMAINAPIQGDGSDFVVDAMNRLSEKAETLGIPWLAPVLNIHDDLSFYVPRKKVDYALELIIPEMITFDFPYAQGIPMMAEASVGTDWYAMEEIGKFDGAKLGITKRAA